MANPGIALMGDHHEISRAGDRVTSPSCRDRRRLLLARERHVMVQFVLLLPPVEKDEVARPAVVDSDEPDAVGPALATRRGQALGHDTRSSRSARPARTRPRPRPVCARRTLARRHVRAELRPPVSRAGCWCRPARLDAPQQSKWVSRHGTPAGGSCPRWHEPGSRGCFSTPGRASPRCRHAIAWAMSPRCPPSWTGRPGWRASTTGPWPSSRPARDPRRAGWPNR